jgi:hypothetical protein
MNKEQVFSSFLSGIQTLNLDDQRHLVIGTNGGEQVRLERFTKPPSPAVTENIFGQ